MNSFISASELVRWRRFLALYLACIVGFGLLLATALLAIDPYDSGRFSLLQSAGVPQFGQRLAFASIARAPNMDTAIIGNSTIQLVDPSRLETAGQPHVGSLAIPGTGPIEQLAVADWFRRHHPGAAVHGLVFGLDASWCGVHSLECLQNPFPFWLYGSNAIAYATHMLQFKSFEAASRMIKLRLGRVQPMRRDGYHDYEAGKVWDPSAFRQRATEEDSEPLDDLKAGFVARFPAAAKLGSFLQRLPASTSVVLVFPPRHHLALPASGSAAAAAFRSCKTAFTALAATRPRTHILDFARDGAIARRDDYFWDQIHYRAPVARIVEQAIASALVADDKDAQGILQSNRQDR